MPATPLVVRQTSEWHDDIAQAGPFYPGQHVSHSSFGSGVVLLTGMILVGCIMPFTENGWKIVHAAVFMIVLAEAVNDASVVYHYRRHS